MAQAIFEPNFFRINTPAFSSLVILHTYPPMKMEQSVPKRRHIKFIRGEITQKKAYRFNAAALYRFKYNRQLATVQSHYKLL
jgi:hypothetical protein